jgi:anaerobic selenocysteine-containing dehydrogenase
MSQTSRHADIVLPAAGWYEKVGIKYLVGLVPYVTISDRAVAPLGESMPEWKIYSLLAQRIAAEAERRGVEEIRSFRGELCDIARLAERFGDGGRFGPDGDEDVRPFSDQRDQGISFDDLRRGGRAMRVESRAVATSNFHSTARTADRRCDPSTRRSLPTLTGPAVHVTAWFLELSERCRSQEPKAGGDYPFMLTSGARASIRWRDLPMMLRLEQGEPSSI